MRQFLEVSLSIQLPWQPLLIVPLFYLSAEKQREAERRGLTGRSREGKQRRERDGDGERQGGRCTDKKIEGSERDDKL